MVKEFKTKEISGTRSVGERLRLSRRRQRLTLEQAERDTKVRLKYLEAFEQSRYDVLPSEVYGLGFLRRYAEYLSLKPDPLIALYKTEWQAALSQVNKDKKTSFAPPSRYSPWQFAITPKAIVVIIIAALVIGLFSYIWLAVRNFSAPPQLIITEPRSDTIINADHVILKGQTDAGAFIYINNESINVDPAGIFSQEVSLHAGTNTVIITAKNRLNRTSVQAIKIMAAPPPSPVTPSQNQTTNPTTDTLN